MKTSFAWRKSSVPFFALLSMKYFHRSDISAVAPRQPPLLLSNKQLLLSLVVTPQPRLVFNSKPDKTYLQDHMVKVSSTEHFLYSCQLNYTMKCCKAIALITVFICIDCPEKQQGFQTVIQSSCHTVQWYGDGCRELFSKSATNVFDYVEMCKGQSTWHHPHTHETIQWALLSCDRELLLNVKEFKPHILPPRLH